MSRAEASAHRSTFIAVKRTQSSGLDTSPFMRSRSPDELADVPNTTFAEPGTVFLLRITRLSVGRRASGFVLVAQCRPKLRQWDWSSVGDYSFPICSQSNSPTLVRSTAMESPERSPQTAL